jgi:phosphate transport system substrate-binding protein
VRPSSRELAASLAAVGAALTLAGCGGDGGGGDGLSGRIAADGSSTVGPLLTAAAERFRAAEAGVNVVVGISGTGGGFERFCRGETDISNASRPIKEEETEVCADNGVEYAELQVANDALTVVVNPANDWADCLTVAELKKIWEPGSEVDNWQDVRAGFPDRELKLFGPGTDSGTFDYFTDEIVGEEGASRSDYSASEDDNVLVRGVAGEPGGLGYFGFSYLEENEGQVRAVEVDGGDGCVEPSVETAQSGEYAPLARPLFVYVKRASAQQVHTRAFLEFVLDNEAEIAGAALYVPLTDAQLRQSRTALSELVGAT